MVARLLCRLGLHDVVVTCPGYAKDGHRFSALGFCTRCNKGYQWDH